MEKNPSRTRFQRFVHLKRAKLFSKRLKHLQDLFCEAFSSSSPLFSAALNTRPESQCFTSIITEPDGLFAKYPVKAAKKSRKLAEKGHDVLGDTENYKAGPKLD